MKGKSKAVTIVGWRELLDRSQPLLEEIPNLEPLHAELAALVAEIEQQEARAQTARSAALVAVRLRREAHEKGIEVRARLAAGLVQHFGPRAERLAYFGIAPRRRKVRQPTEAVKELAAAQEKLAELKDKKDGG
jgi:hypothetical protein